MEIGIMTQETVPTELGNVMTTEYQTTMMSTENMVETTMMSTFLASDATATPLLVPADTSTVSSSIDDLTSSRLVTMTTIVMLSLAITVNFINLAIISCDHKKRQTKANVYAASFLVAEIFYCLNSLVSLYQRLFLPITKNNHAIVHVHLFIDFTCRAAMVVSLGGVVLDRYKAISDVTLYCTRRQLRLACCYAFAGWLVSILFAIPVLAGLTQYWYTVIHSLRPFDIYTSIHTAIVYFIPLLIFSIAYNGLMCRLISCSEKRSLDSFVTIGNVDQQGTRRRLATGTIVTVSTFAFSWLLHLTVLIIDGYFPPSDFQTMPALLIAGNFVAYVGLSVCPILVCLICADYRALDTHRHCPCCSGDDDFMTKMQQAWPASKSNPYYL